MSRPGGYLGGRGSLESLGIFTEAILEATLDIVDVTKAAGTGSASSLGLGGPVVRAFSGIRVTARGTLFFLDVVRATTATNAQRVRLAGALTITGCTFRLP